MEKNTEEIVLAPARFEAFRLDAAFCGSLTFEEIEGNMTKDRKIGGCMVFADATVIFPECHV